MALALDRRCGMHFRNCSHHTSKRSRACTRQVSKHVARAYMPFTSKDGSSMEPMELYSSIKLCPKDSTARLQSAVTRFYEEVWNNSTLDILEELVAEDIVYKDLMFNYGDYVGARRLRNVIAHYLRAYPDLRYTLLDIVTDPGRDMAMVHWSVRGSCLRDVPGMPATGHINQVCGMTKFQMDREGRIQQVHCFRQPFHEEVHALAAAAPDDDFL